MKHLLLSLLLMPATLRAQHSDSGHTPWLEDSADNCCRVVELPENVFPQAMQRSISLLGEPSLLPETKTESLIFDNGYEYVYRLAICIGPAAFNSYLNGDKEKARAWVKETGENLNAIYQRDLGIRFEIVNDERLFLANYPEGFSEKQFTDAYGTKILNQVLGEDNYDCGILIRPATAYLSGSSILSGAYTKTHKGSAMSNWELATIAHELGHMFGGKHTHQKSDGLCIEPGLGQSMMSYGENRKEFSLASIAAIRQGLKNTRYYLNDKRDPSQIGGDYIKENENLPYVVTTAKVKPELDRTKIRKKYTITKNTRFQFYIPVKNAQPSFRYGAQNYDASLYNYETNELQPIYPLSENPCRMFQPYYNEGKNYEGKTDALLESYSDAFRPGRYTFLLAAADGARYDMEKVELNIVEGKPFQFKNTIPMDIYYGRPLNLEWEPCTELYGKNSKVRILLSDDFGQTFKYVLDDQVPNNGKWSGFCPYIPIDRVKYRNFSQTIRGGVVKIEVIGEAAYAVSKEIPAENESGMKYQGGFLLNNSKAYLQFENGPEQYVRLKPGEKIPEMKDLVAFEKNNPSRKKTVQGTEVKEGNVIRRQWKSELNSYPYAYTQVIVIEDEKDNERLETENKAEEIKALANDLNEHKGELGYPIPTLPVMQRLNAAYNEVFDANGDLQKEADKNKVERLRNTLKKISLIGDEDIVKPASRHYYTLRNFQDIYGRYAYFYLAPTTDQNDNNGFTRDDSKATVWRCTEEKGTRSFHDANGRCINLEPFVTPEYKEKIYLDRGFTWGAFTLVNENKACAQLSQQAKYFSRNENYSYDPKGYRINRNGTVSTDFQFVPVEFIEARKPGAERPWNVLDDKKQFTLKDNYSDLFVGKAVSIEQLQYTRQFDDTNWQTLYLPFDTDCKDWTTHCDVACIDGVQFADIQDGEAVAVYVEMKEGKLFANRPYLIRAKSVGKHTFTLGKVTVKPTEEVQAQLAANSHKVCLNGNYGTVSAEDLQKNSGFVLKNGAFVQAGSEVPSMRWYLSIAANSGTTLPQSIRLVEKKDAPVGMISIATQEGYGTVYTDKSYVMPDGVTGYRVTQADADSKELKLVQAFEGGETVPAATPLLVKGEKRTYMLYAPNTEAAEGAVTNQENLLLGAATTGTTTAPNGQNTDDFYFYKLYYGDVDNSGVKRLGFYWGAPNGTPFISQANKAYLAVSKSKANRISGFALPGNNTTGITPMENPEKELVVYTITGVRLYPKSIAELKPGVYVVNGQKKIIR